MRWALTRPPEPSHFGAVARSRGMQHRRIALASALALGLAMTACAVESAPTKNDNGAQTGGAGSTGSGAAGTSTPATGQAGSAGTGTGTSTGSGTGTGTGGVGSGSGTGAAGNGSTTGAAGSGSSTGAAGVGSSTGAAGVGSSTGAAGSTLPIVTGAVPCMVAATDVAIDDFESGLNGAMHACVHGYWYTYNDKSAGTQTPAANMFKPELVTDRAGSTFAAHSTAMGFSGDAMGNAFAAFGLDFDADGTSKSVVDASAFKGVTFWAKGTGTVRVELHTKTSDPAFGCATKCYDVPYKKLTLGAAWQQVTILWTDFGQDKFGTPEIVTGQGLGAIQLASKATMMPIVPYDMWLDDLQFVP
jgi:hypothetical protein